MTRVAVVGKGSLAVHACEVVTAQEGWALAAVVSNRTEPDWDVRLSEVVPARTPATTATGTSWSAPVSIWSSACSTTGSSGAS